VLQITELKTERLLLRKWRDDDLTDFAALNADPEVMEFFADVLDTKESNELAKEIIKRINENGWGFWAVELLSDNSFIGFVGLNKPSYDVPVDLCIEIGWRLAKKYWGHGYATEAAKASLEFAFNELKLDKVYSFASVGNKRSCAVMERLNMVDTNTPFQHPMIPEGSPLREHVLYKIDKQRWQDNNLTVELK